MILLIVHTELDGCHLQFMELRFISPFMNRSTVLYYTLSKSMSSYDEKLALHAT